MSRAMSKVPIAGPAAMAAALMLAGCASTQQVALPRPAVVSTAEGSRVDLPACPDWSRPSAEDFSNRPSSNFGCADAVNLGLQVADPQDLVRGRSGGMHDGAAAAAAVGRFRAGAPRPLGGSGSMADASTAAPAPPPEAEPKP